MEDTKRVGLCYEKAILFMAQCHLDAIKDIRNDISVQFFFSLPSVGCVSDMGRRVMREKHTILWAKLRTFPHIFDIRLSMTNLRIFSLYGRQNIPWSVDEEQKDVAWRPLQVELRVCGVWESGCVCGWVFFSHTTWLYMSTTHTPQTLNSTLKSTSSHLFLFLVNTPWNILSPI